MNSTLVHTPFLSRHARVLIEVSEEPNLSVAEIAHRAGIADRSASRILVDLVEAGYVARNRSGSRHAYTLRPRRPSRRIPSEIGLLLKMLPGRSASR